MVMKIKPYQSKNTLMKLNHTKKSITIAINFISFKDTDEEFVMHSRK